MKVGFGGIWRKKVNEGGGGDEAPCCNPAGGRCKLPNRVQGRSPLEAIDFR